MATIVFLFALAAPVAAPLMMPGYRSLAALCVGFAALLACFLVVAEQRVARGQRERSRVSCTRARVEHYGRLTTGGHPSAMRPSAVAFAPAAAIELHLKLAAPA